MPARLFSARALLGAPPLALALALAPALAMPLATGGCSIVEGQAVEAVDFAGAKGDAYCDRREVADGGTPAAFCQEVVQTVAASQFADDCRSNHEAAANSGLCPRAKIIAGCKLRKGNEDDSLVYDWYYEVPSLDDGGTIEATAKDVDDVARMCADPTRYEDGADLVMP